MKALLLIVPFIFVSRPSLANMPKKEITSEAVSIQKNSSLSLCRLEEDGRKTKGHIHSEKKPATKHKYNRDEFIGNRIQASNFPQINIHKSLSTGEFSPQDVFQTKVARIIDVRYKGKLYFIDSKKSPLARHIFKYKMA